MVRPDKEKKVGFRVSFLGQNLETKWERSYFDEKLKFKLDLSEIGKAGIGVLFWNKRELEIVILKLSDGAEKFRIKLNHEKVKTEPTHMVINGNDEVGIFGVRLASIL